MIEAELGNPELSAAGPAQQLGISRVTLYRLAQPVGGVTRHLRALRLQRASLLLSAEPSRAVIF